MSWGQYEFAVAGAARAKVCELSFPAKESVA